MNDQLFITIGLPTIFGIISLLGILGNGVIIFVVCYFRFMWNPTNTLIANLAVVDLMTSIFVIPFFATTFNLSYWIFGDAGCKIVMYIVYVCKYVRAYTLVMMALDRLLASMNSRIRTQRNSVFAILLMWTFVALCNIPMGVLNGVIRYDYYDGERDVCTISHLVDASALHICTFVIGYVLPVFVSCGLFGAVLITRATNEASERNTSLRNDNLWIAIIILAFGMIWLPSNIMDLILFFHHFPPSVVVWYLLIGVLKYLTICLNPILHVCLHANFRSSIWKVFTLQLGNRSDDVDTIEDKNTQTFL